MLIADVGCLTCDACRIKVVWGELRWCGPCGAVATEGMSGHVRDGRRPTVLDSAAGSLVSHRECACGRGTGCVEAAIEIGGEATRTVANRRVCCTRMWWKAEECTRSVS